MHQNKNIPGPAYIEPKNPPQGAEVYRDTFGKIAVDAAENQLHYEIEHERLQVNNETASQLRADKRGEEASGRFARIKAKRRNRLLSDKDRDFLAKVDQDNKETEHTGPDVDAAYARQLGKYELVDLRYKLSEIDDDDELRAILDEHADRTAGPFVAGVKARYEEITGTEVSWARWLGRKANSRRVLNFFQEQVDLLEQRQNDPETHAKIEFLKAAYKRRVADKIEEGSLSQHAASSLQSLDEAKIYLGDVFDTKLKGIQGRVRGDIASTPTMIVTSVGIEGMGTFYHESNHITLEKGSEQASSLPEKATTKRQKEAAALFYETWLSEALTEHISLIMTTGYDNIIDPDEREKLIDENDVYYLERKITALLLKDLDSRIATRAYSGTLQEKEYFVDAIGKKWDDPDILRKVSACITYLEGKFIRPEAKEEFADLGLKSTDDEYRSALFVVGRMLRDDVEGFGELFAESVAAKEKVLTSLQQAFS